MGDWVQLLCAHWCGMLLAHSRVCSCQELQVVVGHLCVQKISRSRSQFCTPTLVPFSVFILASFGCPCDCIGTACLHAGFCTLLSRSSLVRWPTATKCAWLLDSGVSLMHRERVVTCLLVVMHFERPLVFAQTVSLFACWPAECCCQTVASRALPHVCAEGQFWRWFACSGGGLCA